MSDRGQEKLFNPTLFPSLSASKIKQPNTLFINVYMKSVDYNKTHLSSYLYKYVKK